jgi:hypothetical protein
MVFVTLRTKFVVISYKLLILMAIFLERLLEESLMMARLKLVHALYTSGYCISISHISGDVDFSEFECLPCHCKK